MTSSLGTLWIEALEPLPERQRLTAIAVAVTVLVLVVELVRRRKLREEYSWLWALTGIGLIVLALDENMMVWLSEWIGAANPVSTLFFGAILFLLALALQFSVRLSRLTHRNRTLAQRLALLESELRKKLSRDGEESERSEALSPDDLPAPGRRRGGKGRDEVA